MATNNIKDFRFSIYINNEAARKSLIELEQLSDKYTDTLRRLAAAGKANTAEYTQTKEKLDQVKASMQEMTRQAGLNSLSLSQLTSLKKALNYEFSKAIPGSEKWEKLKSDIQAVNTRMTQLRIQNNQTGLSLKNLAEGANKYIGLITMMIASLTGIVLGIHKTIDAFARWDDKLSDVMKTTGLTKEEVVKLNSELAKINTRTSQMELLDLARVAGKLGISASEEVAGFVRASNQIKVALTEDLGGNVEESINHLGKLVEIFKLKGKYGIEESLLKVGSAINALGAASTANEGYMVEFTKRVAGVAPQANISIQKVLGLAATLDQLGQTSEVSSTVFSAVIPDMFKDTGQYANIAGMSVKGFSKLLKTDANAAFIAFLKGLNQNNGGLAEMAVKLDGLGLEGKRSISVLGALAANTKLLQQQQQLSNVEFQKGTSITQEYNTKNNNAQAELEKARKKFQEMAVELGEKLAPAMTFSTSSLSYFLRTLKLTIEFVAEHKRLIATSVISIVAYTAVIQTLALAENIRNKTGAVTLALTKARTIAENAGIIVTQAYAAATMLLTGNVKGAAQAIRVLNTAVKGSIWGWLAAAVAGVVSYLVLFREESEKASKYTEYYNEALERNTQQLVAEQTEFKGLIRQAMAANEGIELRKKLIEELNQKYPGYLDHIKAEMISNDSLASMLEKVNGVYKEKFRLLQINARMEAIQRQYADKEVEKMKLEEELAKLRNMAITPGSDGEQRETEIKNQISLIEQEQKLMEANMSLIQTRASQIKQDIENITNPSIAILEAKIKEYDKMIKIFQERADNSAPLSLQEQFPGWKPGDEIPANAQTTTEAQKYYIDQMTKAQNDKAEMEQQLTNLREQQNKKTKKGKAYANSDDTDFTTDYSGYSNDTEDSKATGQQFGITGKGKKKHFSQEKFREDYQAWLDKTIDEEISKADKDAKKKLQDMGIDLSEAFDDVKGNVSKTMNKSGKEISKENFDRTKGYMESQNDQKKAKIKADPTLQEDDRNKQLYDAEKSHLEAMKNLYEAYGQDIDEIDRKMAEAKTEYNEAIRRAALERSQTEIKAGYEAGEAAVESANTFKEASLNVLNSIRSTIKAKLAEGLAVQLVNVLKTVPFPFNFAAAAAASAAFSALFDSVVPQFDEGRYPVIGEKDGKTYYPDYQDAPRTGLYTRPTLIKGLGLVAENKSEIVISNPHVKHLQMNYPDVIRTIYRTATRVPQFDDGNYPNGSRTTTTQSQKNTEKEDMMIALLQRIAASSEKPFKGYITYNDVNDAINDVKNIEDGLR